MTRITDTAIEFEPAFVKVDEIIVRSRARQLNEEHVESIVESIRNLGGQALLQPIIVSPDNVLADGAHRLEAAKRSGWERIGAWVSKTPLTEWDIKAIEAEANNRRRDFTPIELHQLWEENKDIIKLETKAARAVGVENLKVGAESPVMGNSYNREKQAVTESLLTERVVGISLDQLKKIDHIKDVSEDNAAAVEVREAAKKALQKLNVPDSATAVTTVFNALVGLQERASAPVVSQEELQQQRAKVRMNDLVKRSTLLAQNLEREFGEDIFQAYSISASTKDDLVGSRNALLQAAAKLLTVEAMHAKDTDQAVRDISAGMLKHLQNCINRYMQDAIALAEGR